MPSSARPAACPVLATRFRRVRWRSRNGFSRASTFDTTPPMLDPQVSVPSGTMSTAKLIRQPYLAEAQAPRTSNASAGLVGRRVEDEAGERLDPDQIVFDAG